MAGAPMLHRCRQPVAFEAERVDAVMREGTGRVFPAAVLLVAWRGTVLVQRAYGYLDPETRRWPVREGSLFDLASLTKLFTATAFMTLVEAGRVSLDVPLADVLPKFRGTRVIGPSQDPKSGRIVPPDPAFAGREVDLRTITFRHLLTHTSGLAAWRGLYREDGTEGERVPLPHLVSPQVRARRIAAVYRCDLAYPPGERVVYSDLGIVLLGEAIARLADMSLDAYVRQAVLERLGLVRTTFNPLACGVSRDEIVPTEVCAWRRRRCWGEVHDENAASLGGVAGHAGLFSTAWEVAVLGQTFLNGGAYGDVRLLSAETVAEMTREQARYGGLSRGLGWALRAREGSSSGRLFGPRSYGHTGFTGTSLWVDPDRELVVVLLTNRVYYGRDPAGIMAFRPRLHDAVVEAMG